MSSTYRFSTEDYPETQRLEAWQELFARKVAGADFTPSSDAPFFASATARGLPQLRLAMTERSPSITTRRKTHLADGNDSILIGIPGGRTLGRQFGREIMLEPGDAFVVATADPVTHVVSAQTKWMSLSLAPTALRPLLKTKGALPFGRIPHDNEPLRLLRRYLATLWDQPLASPDLQNAVSSHVYDLVALALGADRDVVENAKAGGVAAARLNEAKSYVLAHLRKPGLSLDEIAKLQGVTPRYLRMVFEREGVSFSQFVRESRLELAHRMLSSARFADRSISAIAYDAGFGDLSHFNHGFRARYGTTPSDIRAQR